MKTKDKEYRDKHKERYQAQAKEYYQRHKDDAHLYSLIWRLNNEDRITQARQEDREKKTVVCAICDGKYINTKTERERHENTKKHICSLGP